MFYQHKEIYAYELLCLRLFRSALSHAGRQILDRQLDRLDYVQRSSDGKYLPFFDADSYRGNSSWPDADRFAFRTSPAPVFRVTWPDSKGARNFYAEVYLYEGALGGIEFGRKPLLEKEPKCDFSEIRQLITSLDVENSQVVAEVLVDPEKPAGLGT